MTVGERIKERRKELHLTQDELAKRMGYKDKSAICRVEKDYEQNLTLDRVELFAKALSTTSGYLMGWDNDNTDIVDIAPGSAELIDLYARATPEQRKAVINLLRSFVE